MHEQAGRLGLMPWERDRLSPAELDVLEEGRKWRRSRDMEVLAEAVMWVISCHTAEAEYEKVLASMPGYDRQHFKKIDEMRDRALNKMKAKKRG